MITVTYTSHRVEPAITAREGAQKKTIIVENSDYDTRGEAADLEARNRELAAYAHTVAHNLKDPLSVILATSDAIVHITDLTPEELRAYLQQIESTAHAMDDMIDNILLLSELGEVTAPIAPVDMGQVVSHVRMRLGYLIRHRRAQVSIADTWPAAMGYGPWLEEVWANLISNAIKYGGRPPKVELGAAAQPDGTALFWVRDNGSGVPPEARANLFQPFRQVGAIRAAGHGLGLSIVRRIVEKLGGRVGVETEVGRGSQFFFTLPARM